VLDLVVDFTTYVFVPAYAIVAAGLMSQAWALAAGFVIVVTAALYFADGNMKADDNHFVGFPGVWKSGGVLSAADQAHGLADRCGDCRICHHDVPAHQVRSPHQGATPAVADPWRARSWAALALVALWQGLAPQPWVTAALCLIGGYFLVAGLVPARAVAT